VRKQQDKAATKEALPPVQPCDSLGWAMRCDCVTLCWTV
jgi:hypothetical protein